MRKWWEHRRLSAKRRWLHSLPGAIVVVLCLLASAAGAGDVTVASLELHLDRMERQRQLLENRANGNVPRDAAYLWEPFHELNFDARRYEATVVVREFDHSLNRVLEFEYPATYPFRLESEDVRGVFTVYKPRPFLETPLVHIAMVDLDVYTHRIVEDSRSRVWREEVRTNLQTLRAGAEQRAGKLRFNVPLQLPGAIERIIGKGEATNIQVSGQERIEFSGETTKISPFIATEGRTKQSLFPDIEMKQQLNVRLDGTIGEKIHVKLDHRSDGGQGTGLGSQDNNRVEVKYQGLEDEVIKLVEVGDTDLSLQGGRLVSFSQSSQGLFGIKVRSQFGPMDLDVIASKEEGEKANASFSAQGGSATERTLGDVDFIKNRYFALDHPFIASNVHPEPLFADQTKLKIFKSVNPQQVNPETGLPYANSANFGYAFVDRSNVGRNVKNRPPDSTDAEAIPNGLFFIELNAEDDYDLLLNADDNTKVYGVVLRQPVTKNEVLAVTYHTAPADTDSVYVIGNYPENDIYASTDTLYLELIKDENDLPGKFRSGFTWDYMLKNFYDLGEREISPTGFDLQIEELSNDEVTSQPNGVPVPYIRFFGLDRLDETGQPGFDDEFDVQDPVLLDLRTGVLQMPLLRPFDPTSAAIDFFTNGEFDNLPDSAQGYGPNPALYDESHYNATWRTDNRRFQFRYRATSTARTIKLRNINIIEGTETITIDGIRLTRNEDYTIDYEFGSVELQGEILDQLTPDSRINIDYQFQPLIGGGKSSLVGFSSQLNLGPSAKLGTIWLYEATSGGRERPRLGEEPSRALIGDVNGKIRVEPSLMTSLVNVLPLVNTDAKSSLELEGEIAMVVPDPNRKNDAVVDDMEGIDDSDVISLSRPLWYPASPPVDSTHPGFDSSTGSLKYRNDITGQVYRAGKENENFYWLNLAGSERVTPKHLNPTLRDEENRGQIQALEFILEPPSIDSLSWGGVITGLQGGLDITNSQFLEVWVNDRVQQQGMRKGRVIIDFGHIDEDFYEPHLNRFDSEDKPPIGFNATLEDIGLDGIENSEDLFSSIFLDSREIPVRINGTERNGFLDQEDLDRDGVARFENSYFSVEIDLSDSAVVDVYRDYSSDPTADPNYIENDAWRLYRIDLSKAKLIDPTGGTPVLSDITHFRIWLPDLNEMLLGPGQAVQRVSVAKLRIVGNRWTKDGVRDQQHELIPAPLETYALGTINNRDGGADYIPPFSVNEENNIRDREQSLLLEYENLEPGHLIRIRKDFATARDFSLYQNFTVFVHSDEASEPADFFFWIAFDSTNYYEIYHRFADGIEKTANRWRLIQVRMSDLTSLKELPADAWGIRRGTIKDNLDPEIEYQVSVAGNPDLRRVKWFYTGIANSGAFTIPEGEIWINDILLEDVRRDIDYARRFSGGVNFANVFTVNGSWSNRGPDFHGLRASKGSGTENEQWNLTTKFNVKDFVPLLGFNAPVSASMSNNKILPKYQPNSDNIIEGDKAFQDSLRTENTVQRVSVSLNRRGGKNKLLRYTLDRINTSGNVNRSISYRPAARDTTVTLSGNIGYDINFPGRYEIDLPLLPKFRFFPNSFSVKTQGSRTKSWGLKQASPGVLVKKRDSYTAFLNNSGSVTHNLSNDLRTNFTFRQRRNLSLENPTFLGFKVGREISRNQTFRVQYTIRNLILLKAFSPDFDYQVRYGEDSSPAVARQDDPIGTRNVNNNRTTSLTMTFDVGGLINKVGGKLGLNRTGDEERRTIGTGSTAADLDAERKKAFERFQRDRDKEGGEDSDSSGKPQKLGDLEGFKPGKTGEETEGEEKEDGEAGDDEDPFKAMERIFAREDSIMQADSLLPPTQEPLQVPGVETQGAEQDTTEAGSDGKRRLGDATTRRRGAGDRRASESEKKRLEDAKKQKKGSWVYFIRSIYTTFTNIQPIRVTVREAQTTSYTRLWDRPDYAYQFGLTKDSGVISRGVMNDVPNTSRRDVSFQADSGLPLTKQIDIRARYRAAYNVSEGLSAAVSKRLRTDFPDLSLDWKGLENWGIWKGLFNSASVNTSFRRSNTKSGIELDNPLSENFDWSGSATYSANWKNSMVTSLSFNMGNRGTRRADRETGNRSQSLSFDFRYSISGENGIPIPIPFLFNKKIRFKSRLNFQSTLSYSRSSNYEKDLGDSSGFETPLGKTTNLGLNPRFSYQFSRSLNGQFFLRYDRSSNEVSGQTRTTVRVGLSATFNF